MITLVCAECIPRLLAKLPIADNDKETNTESDFPCEKFLATRSDELSVPDVNESSLSDITYAINEMYARHGAGFRDRKVVRGFSQFPCYKPRPGVSLGEIENEFSDLEKQNLKVLQRCRDPKIAEASRKSRPVRDEGDEEPTSQKILRGIQTWQGFGAPIPPHP